MNIGLIPAHAGKTRETLAFHPAIGAHPRSRGENAIPQCSGGALCGSSPLTRGKRLVPILVVLVPRLIPAHAGKTITRLHRHESLPAHPRSRGENELIGNSDQFNQGSSPLTRGKPPTPYTRHTHQRLIPAHAGKTTELILGVDVNRAHPRSRGENGRRPGRVTWSVGSSPLTRGKHGREFRGSGVARLIPAHAGKTLPDLRFYCADRSDLGNP